MDIDEMKKPSMLKWWDLVKDLDIPMPKTVLLSLNRNEIIELYNMAEKTISGELCDKLYMSAREVGYPHFLRTDQTSCKHNWDETCFVKDSDELFQRIHRLIEESSCLGAFGLPVDGFAFREFIPMDSQFKAFHGMPVSPERRYFADAGRIICHHHYWIEDAIRFYGQDPPDKWKELLANMNKEWDDEIRLLSSYAISISNKLTSELGGAWSIDFCRGKDGTWYFIDCAPAVVSWHPPCKNKLTDDLHGG